jgi:hypothetical protein
MYGVTNAPIDCGPSHQHMGDENEKDTVAIVDGCGLSLHACRAIDNSWVRPCAELMQISTIIKSCELTDGTIIFILLGLPRGD